jgi:SAM-dependent methyltransferase
MNGMSSEQMLALHSIPLFSTEGFVLAQGRIDIAGLALAENGDPSGVSFVAEPGVHLTAEYPLPSPGAAPVYWYWPNSDRAAFRLAIHLGTTRHSAEAYRIRIVFAGREQDAIEQIRTTILVPKNLGILENFPDHASLARVQRYDTISSVAMRGLSDAWRIIEVARHYGYRGGRALDWGAGHGRVVRHLPGLGVAEVSGIDIDPLNVGWAQGHLPQIDFRIGPLMPPTPYRDGSFDLLYGISVMTHLTRSVQEAWLEEIARILRPGGLALLTFAGNGAVAFASRYLSSDWMEQYLAAGHGPDLPDKSLEGVIENPDYYKNVKQTSDRARSLCAAYLDVLAVHDCMFGYQDLVVARKG